MKIALWLFLTIFIQLFQLVTFRSCFHRNYWASSETIVAKKNCLTTSRTSNNRDYKLNAIFVIFHLPPEFLPVLEPCTRWCASTLGAALLFALIRGWYPHMSWGLCLLSSFSQRINYRHVYEMSLWSLATYVHIETFISDFEQWLINST